MPVPTFINDVHNKMELISEALKMTEVVTRFSLPQLLKFKFLPSFVILSELTHISDWSSPCLQSQLKLTHISVALSVVFIPSA